MSGWRHFPGYDIPPFFNEGQVVSYMVERMPKIQSVYGKKIILKKKNSYDTVVITYLFALLSQTCGEVCLN